MDANPGFVETFNWIVDFCQNLRGEGEVVSGKSTLRVDRTDESHPVIKGAGSSSGGGGGDIPSVVTVAGAGCFEIIEELDQYGQPTGYKSLANQYYVKGGLIYSTSFSGHLDQYYGKFLALRIPATPSGSASLVAYDDFAGLEAATHDVTYVTRALYQLAADGSVVCDFRSAPFAQVIEVF